MKKYIVKFSSVFSLILLLAFSANAQIVIKVRPNPPVMKVRPIAPGPRHVWVAGDYVWRSDRYVYVDGYWTVPPPRRSHWVEGRWKHRRGGWVWIPGHWR